MKMEVSANYSKDFATAIVIFAVTIACIATALNLTTLSIFVVKSVAIAFVEIKCHCSCPEAETLGVKSFKLEGY